MEILLAVAILSVAGLIGASSTEPYLRLATNIGIAIIVLATIMLAVGVDTLSVPMLTVGANALICLSFIELVRRYIVSRF